VHQRNVKVTNPDWKDENYIGLFLKDNQVYNQVLLNQRLAIRTESAGRGSGFINFLLRLGKLKNSPPTHSFVHFIKLLHRPPTNISDRLLLLSPHLCLIADRDELQIAYRMIEVKVNTSK
jgi:hypothetical protein